MKRAERTERKERKKGGGFHCRLLDCNAIAREEKRGPKTPFPPLPAVDDRRGDIIGTKVRRVQRNQTVLSINSGVRISISKHTFTRQPPPLPPLLPLLPSEKIGLVSIAFPPPKSKDSLRPPVTRVSIRSTHELKRRSGFSSLFSVQGTRSEDHRPPPTDYSSDQNGGGRWRRTRATEDACKFQWMFEGEEGNEKTDPLLAPPFLLRPLSPHARGETAAKSLVDFPPPPSLPTYLRREQAGSRGKSMCARRRRRPKGGKGSFASR